MTSASFVSELDPEKYRNWYHWDPRKQTLKEGTGDAFGLVLHLQGRAKCLTGP